MKWWSRPSRRCGRGSSGSSSTGSRENPGRFWRHRHRRQPAALDRAGQGRDASGDRRRGQRGVGSDGQGGGQAGVAAGGRDEPRATRRDHRFPLPHRRHHARGGAGDFPPGRAGQGRADRKAQGDGLSLLHDLGGLARLFQRKADAACHRGGRTGFYAHQDEGRPRPRRRYPAARDRAARSWGPTAS